MPIRVTVWGEFRHEKSNPKVREIYPDGMHATIANYLRKGRDFEVTTATLDEPEHLPGFGVVLDGGGPGRPGLGQALQSVRQHQAGLRVLATPPGRVLRAEGPVRVPAAVARGVMTKEARGFSAAEAVSFESD